MVLIPVFVPTGAAVGSVGAAGRAVGSPTFPGVNNNGDWENDGSWENDGTTASGGVGGVRGAPAADSGFTYQGKEYDPILNEPMEVSAEIHGDYWEDDMDYSESVAYDGTESKTSTQAKTDEKTCQNCPPEGKVMPMVRRCSRWSVITINYQTRICGTFYNPETQQIQEYKYCGVSFDGWKDKLCQFWEAKARYDQFFRENGKKKNWWTGDNSAIKQAGRHQAVASVNQPLKVVWIFMQPISCYYFQMVFIKMKDIIVHWEP